MKKKLKVVVAEDEAVLCDAICRMIHWNELGYELVGSVGNGLDALRLAEQQDLDLLLTDIRMPFISGIELARQVQELQPMTSIVFLSGYDDFSYAQKAIHYGVVEYLLKPISMEELTVELVKVRQKIEQRYKNLFLHSEQDSCCSQQLISLLNGATDDRWMDQFDIQTIFPQLTRDSHVDYCVFVTQLCQVEKAEVLHGTQALVDNVISQYYPTRSVVLGGRIVSLAVSQKGFDGINVTLDELYQTIRRVMDMESSIGISRIFDSHRLCCAALSEAVDTLRFVKDGGVYHGVSKKARLSDGDSDKTAGLNGELEVLIRSGDQVKLRQYLHSAMKKTEGVENKITPMVVVVTVYQTLQKSLPPKTIDMIFRASKVFQYGANDYYSQEFYDRLLELCLAAQNFLRERSKEGIDLLCSQAMNYIEQHYMEDSLSLSSVSELLHVSPNYLSMNMKKYAGDTFINLLIKKRMSVAAELLCTTKLKVLEISRRCGYTDQHYFSYCFKKYYGISPVQMRHTGKKAEGKYET